MELQALKSKKNDNENSLIKIKVVGIINTIAFQKARLYALKLHHHLHFKFAKPEIIELLQIGWNEYLRRLQLEIGGKTWVLKRQAAVFLNEEFIGSDVDFHRVISASYVINLPSNLGYYERLVAENFKRFCEKTNRTFVYFTFSVDNQKIGSFLFMLYSDLLPRTCEYFMNLCTGENTIVGSNLSYKDTNVYRIVKNGWIQVGDINIDNSGDELPNELIIPDESYCIPHNKKGILSLCNNGKHCNGPSFMISLKSNPWMDYYYVAFGQLIDGVNTLKLIEEIPTHKEHPLKNIKIAHCGKYSFEEEPKIFKEENAFLDYKSQTEDENESFEPSIYGFNKFSHIAPWIYNITDKLDLRDVPSLLMAERYLKGLYCLSSDYFPGMDMNLLKSEFFREENSESNSSSICDINNLLNFFECDETNEETKRQILCRKIVTCAIQCCRNKEKLQNMFTEKSKIVKWVLEVAQQMIASVIGKLNKSESVLEKSNSDLEGLLVSSGTECDETTEKSLSIVEEFLRASISSFIDTLNKEEKEGA